MLTNVDQIGTKISTFYECDACDYITSSKKDFTKHTSTQKHKNRINVDQMFTFKRKSPKNPNTLICSCGKQYSYKQSLSVHRKKCNFNESIQNNNNNEINNNNTNNNKIKIQNEDENINYKEMFLEVMNQNKLLQNTINELIPKVGNNNNNNIIINNITLLNEKCKDALSIDEFIKSIEIDVKHLLTTAEKGLPSGISSLFLEHYNSLPLIKRPLWCADKKRKKLFIKEEEWTEDKNQEKTKEAIKSLGVKQAKNINKYTKENPDWMNNDKKKDEYITIVKESTVDIDDTKQINILNNLLENIHLTNEKRENIQNN
jgi:hypothetical protein